MKVVEAALLTSRYQYQNCGPLHNSRGRFAVEDPLDLGQLGLRHVLLQHRLQALALLSRHPAAAVVVVVGVGDERVTSEVAGVR